MTTPCECCQTAAQFPEYRMFTPKCIFCGARLIQLLGRLQIPVSECLDRRRAVLKDWVQWGHSEAEIRSLVKGPLAVEPPPSQSGPEKDTESASRKSQKRR